MASSSIFGECALPTTVPPYAPFDTSQTCAAGAGLCNYNPLFLLFTASAFRCLCPSGTVPEYTTADDVVCRPVIGTQCRSDGDCNSRATDCLGISTGFPIYFEGTGSQSPFSADLATFLSPIVSFFCSFSDRLAVDTSRGYTCEGGSATSFPGRQVSISQVQSYPSYFSETCGGVSYF
ncbi:uncharacterized protein LOC106167445 [Lingula anatina]|uniref:Uncharacterized protein LOC106167445 n=1 Tax=Lingula anatina TaxID=7574 RepID=A0A1S3IUS5_LINAN|nr:uncharacterized protein LOC106167445 [Lingula anatina]|eukprot:XP_013401686.1 uncharacterized protein LOC106167445 [Lingula anatina]